MERLKGVYLQNCARNLYFHSELYKVLKRLRDEGIPAIVLKGSALLETVYVNPALRPMADIDLLVPEESVDTAQSMVRTFGYRPVGSPEAQERTRRLHRHSPTLVDRAGVAVFEIHSHIVSRDSPFRFDITSFWERARQASIAGLGAQILAPEHLVIHLAVHFFLDRRFRSYAALGQICDLAEALRHYETEMDWPFMKQEVLAHELCGPVHCGLSLARRLLKAPMPVEVLDWLTPQGFDSGSAQLFLRRRVLDTKPVLASSLVTPRSEYDLPNLAGGMLRRLFPTRAYMREHYGNTVRTPGFYRGYLRRISGAGSLLMQYLRNPIELWQEVVVDRWIHSLQNGTHTNPKP